MDSSPSEQPGKPKNTGVGGLSLLPGEFPDPGVELRFPALQANSLPPELPGKPLNKVSLVLSFNEKDNLLAGKNLRVKVNVQL